jgi:hypothetical protein
MLYTKLNLADSVDDITARAMNHMETMAASAILDIASHLHDDIYLSKILADAQYWSTVNGLDCDADMLEGSHAAALMGTAVGLPLGSIVMWDETLASIPAHWQLADGSNGTLDLRNYFPVGVSTTHAQGTTYGVNSRNASGTINVASHVLTIAEIPAHHHYIVEKYHSSGSAFQANYAGGTLTGAEYIDSALAGTTASTGGSQAHYHSGSTWTAGSIENRPPYLAVYFIERVS